MDSYKDVFPKSDIQNYFSGKTIFITGGTGFLGRILVEKLLRSCTDIKKIYIMVRPKKGKTAQERLLEYFNDPVSKLKKLYDSLKQNHSQSLEKLCIINGDCCFPDLDLSENDRNTIISEVNCIFHVAATVRFTDNLKIATLINVRATRDLILLAKKIITLDVFLYVSTAYSFCPRNVIDEHVYEPDMEPDNLIQLVQMLDENKLNSIEKVIIGNWPNTYTYTKALAENVVKASGEDLPVVICRPSIEIVLVLSTAKEPVSGWTNNVFGPTGLFISVQLGLLRVAYFHKEYKFNVVPADFVINQMIASAWGVGSKRKLNINNEFTNVLFNVPVYNYVSSNEKPITWGECAELGKKLNINFPFIQQVWHRMLIISTSGFLVTVLSFLLHTLPAYLMDFVAFCLGKSPNVVKIYKKIDEGLKCLAYFAINEWIFKNDNVKVLWNELEPSDKKLFDFNLNALSWEEYFQKYLIGLKIFILKESLDDLPKAKQRVKYLRIGHYLLCAVLLSLLLSPIYFLANYN